jgi:hypothetical protein
MAALTRSTDRQSLGENKTEIQRRPQINSAEAACENRCRRQYTRIKAFREENLRHRITIVLRRLPVATSAEQRMPFGSSRRFDIPCQIRR